MQCAAYAITALFLTSAASAQSLLTPPYTGNSDSGKISSPYGPRNLDGKDGSSFHHGVDYNLAPGNEDLGYLVPLHGDFSGTIQNILIKRKPDNGGHSVLISYDGTRDLVHF